MRPKNFVLRIPMQNVKNQLSQKTFCDFKKILLYAF